MPKRILMWVFSFDFCCGTPHRSDFNCLNFTLVICWLNLRNKWMYGFKVFKITCKYLIISYLWLNVLSKVLVLLKLVKLSKNNWWMNFRNSLASFLRKMILNFFIIRYLRKYCIWKRGRRSVRLSIIFQTPTFLFERRGFVYKNKILAISCSFYVFLNFVIKHINWSFSWAKYSLPRKINLVWKPYPELFRVPASLFYKCYPW